MSPWSTPTAPCSPPSASAPPAAPTTRPPTTRTGCADAVQTMLDRVVGPGNATVVVAADMNYESAQRVEESFTDAGRRPGPERVDQTETYAGTGRRRGRRARPGQHRRPRRQRRRRRNLHLRVRDQEQRGEQGHRDPHHPGRRDQPADRLRGAERRGRRASWTSPRSPTWSPPRPESTPTAATRSPSKSSRSTTPGPPRPPQRSPRQAGSRRSRAMARAVAHRDHHRGIVLLAVARPHLLRPPVPPPGPRAGRPRRHCDEAVAAATRSASLPPAPVHRPIPFDRHTAAREPGRSRQMDIDRKRAEIDALAAADPERTAEFLRGLMDEKQTGMSERRRALTGTQKVAVVLMHMDQDRAAQVMKQFSEAEAEQITAEIVRLRRVDPTVAAETVQGVPRHDRSRAAAQPRGGRDFAAGLLEASFGSEKAAGVHGPARLLDGRQAVRVPRRRRTGPARHPARRRTAADHRPGPGAPARRTGLGGHRRAGRRPAHRRRPVHRHHGHRHPGGRDHRRRRRSRSAPALSLTSREPIEVVGGIQPLVDIINRADVATERAAAGRPGRTRPGPGRGGPLADADLRRHRQARSAATCSRSSAASTRRCWRSP